VTSRNNPDRAQHHAGSVASFVRSRRKANKLSQRGLAELAGVGMRFLSELERGKKTLRMDAVNAVLAVFGKELGAVDVPRVDEREGGRAE
jgi:y4mF family transcriptional regulator